MIICNNFVMLLLMKKITLFLSALLLSASLVVPAFAASPYDGLAVANVKNEPLNMRTGPSTDADIIGKCYRGCGGNCPRAPKTAGHVSTLANWKAGLKMTICCMVQI